MTYDLIIVGAGPSGMTAGVFAARKGLKTLIISKDIGGQVNWTTDIENYMGFQEIDGQALMARFEEQVKELQLEEKLTEVTSLNKEGDFFKIKTTNQEEFTAKAVIISSGKKPKTLNVPGETEFRNKGVSYCSTCDGPLFRNLPVAVAGGGNSAVKSVLDLANYASEIHLITMGGLTADLLLAKRLDGLTKLRKYLQHTIVEIKGAKSVEKILVEEVKTKQRFELPVQGVFIEIGLDPNNDFLGDLVRKNEAKEISIDCFCRTNVPGLYAAGDVTSVPEKQIIVAAGEGAKAALKAWEYLIKTPDSNYVH
ncbi:MAG: NAD(P)/FAD-dependent oxidoreductase [Bacillota bacterium]